MDNNQLSNDDQIQTEINSIIDPDSNLTESRTKIQQAMLNKMLNIKSIDMNLADILKQIENEAEQNFIKILDYLNESYEYQVKSFNLSRSIFYPNIYRLKNDTFYVLKFIPQYEGKSRKRAIKQFQEKYPDIKMHVLTYKQYKRIVNWFKEKVELKNQVYYTNYQHTRVITQQCVHCGNRFQTNSTKNKFCSDQCATEYNARQEAVILAKRNYYNGY